MGKWIFQRLIYMWNKHDSVNTAFTVASQPPKPTCHPHVRHAYLFFCEVSPRYVIIDLRVDRIKCTSQQQCDHVSKFFYQSCLDLVGLPSSVLMMMKIFEAGGDVQVHPTVSGKKYIRSGHTQDGGKQSIFCTE